MPTKVSAFPGLTGNQLKLLAMLTMTMVCYGSAPSFGALQWAAGKKDG